MAREYYVGFDPGKKGFACVYEADTNSYEHYPVFDGKRLNARLIGVLKTIGENFNAMAVVEQVHSMPHQGVASTFTFGTNYGMLLGALEALGVPYVTVTPGKWQKAICEAVDKADNTKLMHYNAARRLLPNMDFRRSERCKTFDDNKVDATLICLYAQRKQL